MKKYRLTKTELEKLIEEKIIGLHAERNKEIVKDKLFVGLTIQQIAEKHGLSETRTKTVIRTFKRIVGL